MNTIQNISTLRQAFTFAGAALIVWTFIAYPERSLLMRSLSTLTILAFFLLLGQFICTRKTYSNSTAQTICNLFRLHNVIGYICVSIVLLHPVFLVIPKIEFEGITPSDALITIVTNFSSSGIVFGIIAWMILAIIGLTAAFRTQLPIKYTTWKSIHAALAALFTLTSAYHVLDLGRHVNLPMTILIVLLAGCGCMTYLGYENRQHTQHKNKIQL